jgi:hypothetical protein
MTIKIKTHVADYRGRHTKKFGGPAAKLAPEQVRGSVLRPPRDTFFVGVPAKHPGDIGFDDVCSLI